MAIVSSKSDYQSSTVRDLKMDERRRHSRSRRTRVDRAQVGRSSAGCPASLSSSAANNGLTADMPLVDGHLSSRSAWSSTPSPSSSSSSLSSNTSNKRLEDGLSSPVDARIDWTQVGGRRSKTDQSSGARTSIRVVRLPTSNLRLTAALGNIRHQRRQAAALCCAVVLLALLQVRLSAGALGGATTTSINPSSAERSGATVISVKIGEFLPH